MVTQVIKYVLQRLFPNSFILGRIRKCDGVILTFDDGPHPKHTPLILAELARREIKAVFFVSGIELEKYPELGRLIVEQGHLLGNHTFEHPDIKHCSLTEYKQSVNRAEQLIELACSGRDYRRLFRPPYSSFSLEMLSYFFFSDYLLLNWNVDSRDSFILNADELVEYVSSLPIRSGDILLFHEDYAQTVAALPAILEFFQSREQRFVLPGKS